MASNGGDSVAAGWIKAVFPSAKFVPPSFSQGLPKKESTASREHPMLAVPYNHLLILTYHIHSSRHSSTA
jgi:hypothetical protein